MKKLILLMTAFFLVSGVTFAGADKGKKKKCAKGKTCCAKKAEDQATAEGAEKKSCGSKEGGKKACCKSKTAEM